jgi:signal transduction histidine kinase
MHRFFVLVSLVAWLMGTPAVAQPDGTFAEAKALAERAAAHMREVGPELAVADFNNRDGGYVDRNLFVVTYNPQRRIVSSLGVPAYLGRDATHFVDADGKEFGKAIIDTAERLGTGWVGYRMTNPSTMKVELKSSYVIKCDDYIIFVGAYRP